jgi:hypothetical protein
MATSKGGISFLCPDRWRLDGYAVLHINHRTYPCFCLVHWLYPCIYRGQMLMFLHCWGYFFCLFTMFHGRNSMLNHHFTCLLMVKVFHVMSFSTSGA